MRLVEWNNRQDNGFKLVQSESLERESKANSNQNGIEMREREAQLEATQRRTGQDRGEVKETEAG
jgi:hypothetical protein